jgi:uncharacterized protein YukE
MATITVHTEVLRQKARQIRSLLEESKTTHQQLWTQITGNAGQLPPDLASSHDYANAPWNDAVGTHYDNYARLAQMMEEAADAYDRGDKNVQLSFTPSNQ